MHPDMKTGLKRLGDVAFMAIVICIVSLIWPHMSNAQNYNVTLSVDNATTTHYTIGFNFEMLKTDAQYYNKRFGTEELQRKAQQFVDKWIRDRIANEKDNDARRAWKFVPEATKQKALDDEQAYRDTVGTSQSQQQIN